MSCATFGLAGVPVRVEADLANGLPQFNVVGLTDRAIQEARERVRAAIRNTGYPFPSQRITVNLAPAEVPKEGTGFDLAIALSILVATVRGQARAKRALEIAAAGGHNVLMTGPPGSGKTMLARAFTSLLPDIAQEEALEVAAIYSLRGALRERPAASVRPPFRSPHHSVSRAGLVGGGTGMARPGEISLAHRGVLFLDELCEFPRSHLEALRQPLDERTVTVVRARAALTYPAHFMLLAAANP